jgi:hypothetical protein
MKHIYGYLAKTGKKLRETHPAVQAAAFFIFLATIACIFFIVVFDTPSRRHLFYFPAYQGTALHSEARYLAKTDDDNRHLEQVIDEILLGPLAPGSAPLFPAPVRTLNAFIRNREAYIHLTAAEAAFTGENQPPDRAFEIFKKNVFTNFRNLAKIYLYIDGIEVYVENPYAGAGQPE